MIYLMKNIQYQYLNTSYNTRIIIYGIGNRYLVYTSGVSLEDCSV